MPSIEIVIKNVEVKEVLKLKDVHHYFLRGSPTFSSTAADVRTLILNKLLDYVAFF